MPVLKLHIYAKNGEKYAESTVVGKRRKDGAKCRFLGRFAIQFLLNNVKIRIRLSKRLNENVKWALSFCHLGPLKILYIRGLVLHKYAV